MQTIWIPVIQPVRATIMIENGDSVEGQIKKIVLDDDGTPFEIIVMVDGKEMTAKWFEDTWHEHQED